MAEPFNLHSYLPALDIAPANATLALLAAIASLVALKALLFFSRRKLCRMSEEQSSHAWERTVPTASSLATRQK